MKLTQVDITWNYADAAVWSAVEPNVAVISACLPMLQPVVKLVSGSFGSMGNPWQELRAYSWHSWHQE